MKKSHICTGVNGRKKRKGGKLVQDHENPRRHRHYQIASANWGTKVHGAGQRDSMQEKKGGPSKGMKLLGQRVAHVRSQEGERGERKKSGKSNRVGGSSVKNRTWLKNEMGHIRNNRRMVGKSCVSLNSKRKNRTTNRK